MPYQAFFDLTAAHAEEFNRERQRAAGALLLGGRPDLAVRLASAVALPARILAEDGRPQRRHRLSPSSARGEDCDQWEADHFNLVNWKKSRTLFLRQKDRLPDYARLIRRLTDEGF